MAATPASVPPPAGVSQERRAAAGGAEQGWHNLHMPPGTSPCSFAVASSPVPSPVPAGFTLRADPTLVQLGAGVLLGGDPPRVVRLRPPADGMLDRWLQGAPVGADPAEGMVARRLVSAGLVQPVPSSGGPRPQDVTVVVPVRDRAGPLAALLASLEGLDIVVVDDGSLDPEAVRAVVGAVGARCLRLDVSRGPGGARDAGLGTVVRDVVVFMDSDCVPAPGWLPPLLAHFQDPVVGAVAPRVQAADLPNPALLDAYELLRSPLDQGPRPGLVRAGGRIPFVPTATLALRRSAVGARCFDPQLPGGEDVDLVWRLVDAGWDVRYEPGAVVHHRRSDQLVAWCRRRTFYGTTAGPLARRHPGALAPASVSGWTAATWALVLTGRPLLGGMAAATSIAILARRMHGLVGSPWQVAARLAGVGTMRAPLQALAGTARVFGPALVVAIAARRTRLAAATWLVAPAVADWLRAPRRADVPLHRYVALHVLDDVAYGCGVWIGCARARTLEPLLPHLACSRQRPRTDLTRRSGGA